MLHKYLYLALLIFYKRVEDLEVTAPVDPRDVRLIRGHGSGKSTSNNFSYSIESIV